MLKATQELNANSELSKTFSSLLEQMSERIPEAMISSTQSLIEFLDCESHLIRNAVIRVFEKLIAYTSSMNMSDASSEEYATLREELFQVLVERFLDVSSYTRAQVIQSWSFFCSERLIEDHERYNMIAHLAVSRLRDKAALVRKFAMRLFCDLLTFNPYHKNLCLSFWEKVGTSLDREIDQADEDALTELQGLLEKSKQAMEFVRFVREAIARATQLLGSRTQSDVIEAIRFLSRASFFCGNDTADGIKVVLTLVCSNEAAIKEAAKEAYIEMFFSPEDTKIPTETYIAKNLIALTQHATLGQMISLEELLKQLYKMHDKKVDDLSQKLRDMFTLGVKSELTYGSIIVLSMMASIYPVLVVGWLPSILQHGLGKEAVKDPQLAKWSCVAIQKLALYLDGHPAPALPVPLDDTFFKFFTDLLELRGPCQPDQDQATPIEGKAWYPAAEQAIAVIYALSKNPEAIMERILGVYALNSLGSRYFKKPTLEHFKTEGLFSDGSSGLSRLSRLSKLERLVFLAGQVATRQIAFIERVAWNKRVRRAEEQLERKSTGGQTDSHNPCGDQVESSVYEQQMIEDLDRIKMNDEVDMKDEQEDYERAALERSIVQPSSLIGALYPIIRALCQSEEVRQSFPFLHGMAIDAFSRLTLSCPEQCATNIGSLSECLSNRKTKAETRRNIVVAFCDFATRFPNEFETQASVLFDCLSEDEDPLVKRNALLVLSHLIFTLRIKPRGRLGDLAMCLVSKDPYVSNLSQLFFRHLAKNKKEEYIKCLPEMLNSLLFEKKVPIQVLEDIVPFLFSFIETQAESVFMVEKLCSHFQTSMIDQNQVLKSLAYLVTCLSHSDATILRLIQLFKYYKHAIYEDQVKGYFLSVCAKARRLHASSLANQLEEMILTGEAMETDPGSSTRQRSTLLKKVRKKSSK
ncbi:uncharacterized protein LOC126318194 [Schistocerca gregaria]|uniref:uncharacterized protein LOC126318194 n=1 Tax=Schistocerca gregaria TaxID=7010 RepID=UPI00211E693A|nr:uncharacterized protein LOC126318194 [Schistocerca gregaria]